MRTPFLLLTLAAGLMAQSAPKVSAESPKPAVQGSSLPESANRHRRAAHRQEHLAKALGLSETQRGQIKQIRERHKEVLHSKHAAMRTARQSLAKAMQDPKTPEADLRKLHSQMADMRFDLMLELRAMRGEVNQVLTPEQREKAAELRGRAMEHGRMMRGLGMAG